MQLGSIEDVVTGPGPKCTNDVLVAFDVGATIAMGDVVVVVAVVGDVACGCGDDRFVVFLISIFVFELIVSSLVLDNRAPVTSSMTADCFEFDFDF